MYLNFFIIIITLSISNTYAAATDNHSDKHEHGSHNECELPTSSQDIIQCALWFHPTVKREGLGLDSADKLLEKASQIPNPTLNTNYVIGDNNGEDLSELEANISFKIETGGKRDSRKQIAIATKDKINADLDLLKSNIKIATIVNMYRLRQILEEKKLMNETLKAFSKVTKQLNTLPRLSADQDASLTLFEIAYEETKVAVSELFEEEREIEHFFHIATGHSLNEIMPYLPNESVKWPKLHNSISKSKDSPEIKRLKAMGQIATKTLALQKSKAWPDLQIGPSFSMEKEGSKNNKLIGINFSMPIPMFNTNGGGKSYARSQVIKAQKSVELTRAEESHERFEQLRVYQSSVRVLKKTMKRSVIEKKQKKIQDLYLRGVITSSVFLESLKQKLSYLKSRNHREITAVTSLWNIYKYDGNIFTEKL